MFSGSAELILSDGSVEDATTGDSKETTPGNGESACTGGREAFSIGNIDSSEFRG